MIQSNPTSPSRLSRVKLGGIQTLPRQGEQLIVSIDRLIENPDNERRTFRNMEGLIETVRKVGIIEPLIVEQLEDRQYLIVVGHRRYRAAQAARLEKVPIIIGRAVEAAERRRKSIISNVQREDVDPVEMAEGLQALIQEDPEIKTQRDLARMIGKSDAWVSDMLRILTLPPDLLQKLRSNETSIPYNAVMRIARVESRVDQERLIDTLLKGATQRDIRREIATLEGKPMAQDLVPSTKKPKEVFHTSHGVTVIVQSQGDSLSPSQIIDGLKESLKQAHGRS